MARPLTEKQNTVYTVTTYCKRESFNLKLVQQILHLL